MIRDNYLDISRITADPGVLKIFKIIRGYGGVVRFVGGAVRDALAGLKAANIDLSTDLSPDELAEACEEAGIRTAPIGLKIDTLGVAVGGTLLEISSLKKQVKGGNGRTEVEFTDNWEEDASRRDLTINAVYADENGNVFDYYNGIEDLENGIIRFIGDANRQIREDYVRILRFFRFYSLFGKAPADAKALKACRDNLNGLKNLPVERIRDELVKILLTPKAAQTLKLMFENDILGYWLTDPPCFDELETRFGARSGTAAVCPFPAGQNAGRKHCRTAEVPQKPKGKPDPAGRSGRRRRGFFVGGEAETGGLPAGQRRLSFPASAAGCGKPRRQNRSG